MEQRLIDANAFKKYLKEKYKEVKDQFQTEKMRSLAQTITNDFCSDIDEQPTVDAVPVVHGYWIIKPHGTYGQLRAFCSACGKHSGIGGIVSNQKKPYCPNCGARMRGANDDNA